MTKRFLLIFTSLYVLMSSAIGAAYALYLGRPQLDGSYSKDGALYAYIGYQWAHGRIPYLQGLEIKPPGAFAINALTFGFAGRSTVALAFVEAIFLIACPLILFLLLRRRGAPFSVACLAALITSAASSLFIYNPGNLTEVYVLAPACLSMLCFVWQEDLKVSWLFASGIFAGVAALCKTVGIAPLLAQTAMLLLLWAGRRYHLWKTASLLVADWTGALVPWFASLLYFHRYQAAKLMLEASFPTGYQHSSWSYLPLHSLLAWIPNLKYVGGSLVAAGLGLVIVLADAGRLRKIPTSGFHYLWTLFLLWCGADIAGALAAGNGFEHYFLCAIPSLATLSAMLFWHIRDHSPSTLTIRLSVFALLFVPVALFQPTDLWRLLAMRHAPIVDADIISWLNHNKRSEDTLFVLGFHSTIPFYTNMPFPGPMLFQQQKPNEVLQELRTTHPSFLVDATVAEPLAEQMQYQEFEKVFFSPVYRSGGLVVLVPKGDEGRLGQNPTRISPNQ